MNHGATRVRRVVADAAALRWLAYHQPHDFPVLLDSSAVGPLGRYSILGAYPEGVVSLDARRTIRGSPSLVRSTQSGFLLSLEDAWRRERALWAARLDAHGGETAEATGLPFRGGWMLYLSYEMAAEVEPQLQLPSPRGSAAPLALALRVPAALILDQQQGDAWGVCEPGREGLLGRLEADLRRAAQHGTPVSPTGAALPALQLHEEPAERFVGQVQGALEYIRAGDIYQANLSRAWRAVWEDTAGAGRLAPVLYERLRTANPAPFAGLVQHQDWRLLSSSPERLVRIRDEWVETRPIAGTRPRSGRPGEDEREIAALIAHPKERAEHVMLIDLERNDLGRICRAGSVRAEPMMFTESYAHVHHIVSSVTGRLRSGLTPLEVIRAVFPGGTITGCPKFRCMQIIAELEGEARGAYTGALGFLNHDGSMDLNILIRTLTLADGQLELRAGAGIVADSDPQRELEETRAKARGLLAALGAVAPERR